MEIKALLTPVFMPDLEAALSFCQRLSGQRRTLRFLPPRPESGVLLRIPETHGAPNSFTLQREFRPRSEISKACSSELMSTAAADSGPWHPR